MYNILYCFVMSCQYVLMSGYPQSVWNSLFVFSPTLSSQFIVFWQYSSDAVSSVRSTSTHFISIRPCFHHAGGNHEPYRRDAATGGAAHDDQENAGDLRCDRELKKTFCVCVYPNVLTCICHLFVEYTSSTVCAGDLEGLFHWSHRVSGGEWGAQVDGLYFPQGLLLSGQTIKQSNLMLILIGLFKWGKSVISAPC